MERIDGIIINKDDSIKDALKMLNSSELLILLVLDNEGRLERTITDGDIRRLLLDEGSLDRCISDVPYKEPVVVLEEIHIKDVSALMYSHGVNQIPVVNEFGHPLGLHVRKNVDTRILLSTPHLTGEEQEYVKQAFDTNWVTPLGPNVDAFEREISDYIGGSHVAAVNAGTSAIHLALRLLDVSRDDVVFCQSFTFVASANPILYQGATPVFIDSEPNTWNMSPEALRKALCHFDQQNKLPKAIIVVHLYGQSADMAELMKVSNEYDVPIVEDAAESLGAYYQGKHTGTTGKFGIFSFNGNKIITTSGGGALVSDDEGLIKRARFLSTQAKDPAPHYEHTEVGYNYRMSNILAGVGRGQLKVLDDRVNSRRNVLKVYKAGLKEIEAIEWMPEPEGDYSNCWLSVLSINPRKTDITVKKLIAYLSESNIEARHIWKPMHIQPLFDGCKYFSINEKSYCDYLFETGVCLPSSSNITIEQQNVVIQKITQIFSSAK